MTKNLEQLREVAERATPGPWEKRELPVSVGNSTCTIHAPNAVGIPTWSPLPPEIAGILKHEDATHIATFDPPTALALIDRAEAAERAVDFHTQRDHELKTLLSVLADRLDEFSYDELSSLIEDGPLDQWGETYKSKLQTAEQAVQRVREVIDQLDDHSRPRTAHKFTLAKLLRRALDGGEQK